MFNNVFCVEKEERCSTVGVFDTGRQCVCGDVLFVKSGVKESAACIQSCRVIRTIMRVNMEAFPAASLSKK